MRIFPTVSYTGYTEIGCTLSSLSTTNNSIHIRVDKNSSNGIYRLQGGKVTADAEL